MRVLIMGAGSVGSVVAGFMAKAGHDLTLIGRKPHMDAIDAKGLKISGIWGEHEVHGLKTATDLSGLEGPFDFILMSVKSYDTRSASEAIAPFVGEETLVCSYQNGLGNAETIAEVIGWEHVIDARVIYGVWLPEPGHAEVTVTADATALGGYHDAVPIDRIRAIAHAMDEAGIPTRETDSIATYLWSKVAYNCALNPLSALLDAPYGELLDTENTKSLMREIVTELYAIAEAEGIALDPDTAEGYIERLFTFLIPVTAEHYASMREDFRRERRTEIDVLNGAISDLGEKHNIPCPTNLALTRLIRAREHAYLARAAKRGPSS